MAALVLACGLGLAPAALPAPSPPAGDPRPAERGFPLIQTVRPALPEISTQNFGITRDPSGVLFIANPSGVLSWDGAWWRLIRIGKAGGAYALACDSAGRIGVGGFDEIGFLQADAEGRQVFTSLAGELPEDLRNFGQVIGVEATARGFLYISSSWLAAWDGKQLHVLERFPGTRPFPQIYGVDDAVYAWLPHRGLLRFADGELQTVAGGDAYVGRRIDALAAADGGLLVSVRGEGFFLLRGGVGAPFAPAATPWALEHRVITGTRLPDGRWAFGSVVGGLLILSAGGEVENVIDASLGLPSDFVTGLVLDRDGALWLSLDQDLARLEIASALSVHDRRSGLPGNIYTAIRHAGTLWVGTSNGLFRAQPATGGLRFAQVPGVPVGGWSLLPLRGADGQAGDLLVGSAFGVYRIGADGRVALVPGTDQRTAYVMAASSSDPGRIWVGTPEGLLALRQQGATLAFEGAVEGAPHEVRTLVERDGTLWVGSSYVGSAGLDLPYAPAHPRWRPVGEAVDFYPVGDAIMAAREKGFARLDPARASLSAAGPYDGLDIGAVASMAVDAGGDLWLGTQPPTQVRVGEGGVQTRLLYGVPARAIENIVAEADGVLWLTGENGLYRLASPEIGGEPLPAPRISSIEARGVTLFGGASQATPGFHELPPRFRRLRIEYAPNSFRAGLRFQTRLEPLDEEWGALTAEPFTELTSLPPGDYVFRVRSLAPGPEVSPETSWAFRVRTPWYATFWAAAGALALLVLAIRFYAALRGRTLRQRALRLEQLVDEKTTELQQTVERLREAQHELEAANARLEEQSLRDPLTGVANRRPLVPALEAEWRRAARQRQDLGFVLLDLDHFKALNDSRGHREGDRCLQAVAVYLAGQLGRAGDLLCRYGGEEFAILLPETDLAGATALAESLRAGIEALGLDHPAAPAGHVTASFGVAAWKPELDQRPESLIEAADLALYRAKTGGRNLVCATAAPPGSRGFDLVPGKETMP